MQSFDAIPITTAVLVGRLSHGLALDVVFPLLPLSSPDTTTPGAIHRVQYGRLIRGEIANAPVKKKGYATKGFPNNLNCKIHLGHKLMDVKVSSESIQITGVKSVQDGNETMRLFFDHLVRIERAIVNEPDTLEGGHDLAFREWIQTKHVFQEGVIPDELVLHSEFVMVNKNSTLNAFPSALGPLARRIKSLEPRFGVMYVNTLHHYIVVWVRDTDMDAPPGGPAREHRETEDDEDDDEDESTTPEQFLKRPAIHKFTLHRSGQMTQSGRNLDRMAQVYQWAAPVLDQAMRPLLR